MPFYLLQENGEKLALEDLSGFLLLENSPPEVAVVLIGGDDAPKKKRRNRTKELYDALARTIHELVAGVPPAPIRVEGGTLVLEGGEPERTLQQLASLVRESTVSRKRLAELRVELEAYLQAQREEEEDAELMLLLS